MKQFLQRALSPEKPLRLALILSFPLIILLALLTMSVIGWEQKSLEEIQLANMKDFSRAFHNHIVATGVLDQSHGGIYIEVIQHAGQKPYKKNTISIMGREFVRIDPLMLTTQLIDLIEKRNAYQFHITALNATSRAGAPDPWEQKALKEFLTGKREESTIMKMNNRTYYRYMAPLNAVQQCLSCHKRGINEKVTSILGGLSLVIPLEPMDRLFAVQVKKSVLSFAGFGIFVTLIIISLTVFFSRRISASFKEISEQQKTLFRLNEQLSLLSARDSAILGSILDGILIINEKNLIERVNEAFSEITGMNPDTVIGNKPSDINDAVFRDNLFSSDQRREFTHNDRVYIVDNIPVSSKKTGRLLCSLRLIHDATDEKLSAAMELAGATAHEVRQPLSILLSLTDMIRDDILGGKDVSDKLVIFNEQIQRIDSFIAKILKLRKYQTKAYTKDIKILDVDDSNNK